jgi:hypothetical protein
MALGAPTSSTTVLIALSMALAACTPPEGPEPALPGEQPAEPAQPQGSPRVDPFADIAPLPLPSPLPAAVYTRAAPASLVNERGAPKQVLSGHHTLLELRHHHKDRALVACRICPEPVEGWIQVNMLMSPEHLGDQSEHEDDRLGLALYAAELRRSLQQQGSFPGHEPSEAERELLLQLLDQGFVREEDRAIAPASGEALSALGASIQLARTQDGWEVVAPPPARPEPDPPVH